MFEKEDSLHRTGVVLATVILLTITSIADALAEERDPAPADSIQNFLFVSSPPGSLENLIEAETSIQLGDEPPPTDAGKDAAEGPFYAGFRNFHRVLGYNFTRGLISRGNLLPLLIGRAGGLTAYSFDEEVSEALWGTAPAWGNIGDVLGSHAVILGSTGSILAVTPFVKSERFKGFSFTLTQAIILNNVLTASLKAAVSRTRPNEESDTSFPSGHASNVFAWSTVAANYYGWKIGVPAYAVAGFVALSRVERGAHYLSDIIAGSTVGFISGITAVRGSRHGATNRNWALMPSFGRDHTAI
jgi:membrane-associated phospholipid phosphatase